MQTYQDQSNDHGVICILLPPVSQEAADPLTGGGRYSELDEPLVEDFKDDGAEYQAEIHKQNPVVQP